MRKSTASVLALLIGLSIFLTSPLAAQTAKETICELIYARCRTIVLAADSGPVSTYYALQECEMARLACYLLLFI